MTDNEKQATDAEHDQESDPTAMNDLDQGRPVEDSAGAAQSTQTADMESVLISAIASLKNSTRLDKHPRGAAFALPWYLFLGTSGARISDILEQVPAASDRSSGGVTGGWRFHQLANLIAIEGHASLLGSSGPNKVSEAADTALGLLRKHRRAQPLSGLVAVVSAHEVLNGGQRIDQFCAQIRTLTDRAYAEFGQTFPVILLILGIGQMDGHDAFFAKLPDQARLEAIGYRPDIGASRAQTLAAELQGIVERLRAIRLTVLSADNDVMNADGVFSFPEQIAALTEHDNQQNAPIDALDQGLLGKNNYLQDLQWRGIYLVAEDSADRHHHLHDLFERFLPEDGRLAG